MSPQSPSAPSALPSCPHAGKSPAGKPDRKRFQPLRPHVAPPVVKPQIRFQQRRGGR